MCGHSPPCFGSLLKGCILFNGLPFVYVSVCVSQHHTAQAGRQAVDAGMRTQAQVPIMQKGLLT